jgi:muconolactone delta-isomerase
MEYLVTMTTHVPEGTPEAAVDDVRAREAAHSRDLAAQRHLLRLWRPPLEPGEWRSLGLFAAGDDAELEAVLASMPLHVWRTDEVTPLSPHPNDPPPALSGPPAPAGLPDPPAAGGHQAAEFLTTFTVTIPEGTPAGEVAAADAGERDRTRELAAQGHLERLWGLPGQGRALGLWRAGDRAAMQAILASLPLGAWLDVQTTPVTPHPSDPGITRG